MDAQPHLIQTAYFKREPPKPSPEKSGLSLTGAADSPTGTEDPTVAVLPGPTLSLALVSIPVLYPLGLRTSQQRLLFMALSDLANARHPVAFELQISKLHFSSI